jgi:hypothetical protein
MTRRGRALTITSARCTTMRVAEEAARRASEQAQRLAERRAEQRAAAERQASLNSLVRNCKALGGTPVQLDVGGQPWTFCRAPWGGLMVVPR